MVLLYQVRVPMKVRSSRLTYVSLPIGAFTIAVIVLILAHPKQEDMSNLTWKEQVVKLDIPGNTLFMVLVVCAIQIPQVRKHCPIGLSKVFVCTFY